MVKILLIYSEQTPFWVTWPAVRPSHPTLARLPPRHLATLPRLTHHAPWRTHLAKMQSTIQWWATRQMTWQMYRLHPGRFHQGQGTTRTCSTLASLAAMAQQSHSLKSNNWFILFTTNCFFSLDIFLLRKKKKIRYERITENPNLHWFELLRPSIKVTRLLLTVIKAIIVISTLCPEGADSEDCLAFKSHVHSSQFCFVSSICVNI